MTSLPPPTLVLYRHLFGSQGLCESRGGRPGLPVPNNKPARVCGRQATLKQIFTSFTETNLHLFH